jgi:hypothetical protein
MVGRGRTEAGEDDTSSHVGVLTGAGLNPYPTGQAPFHPRSGGSTSSGVRRAGVLGRAGMHTRPALYITGLLVDSEASALLRRAEGLAW